jgi:hypothetical protein
VCSPSQDGTRRRLADGSEETDEAQEARARQVNKDMVSGKLPADYSDYTDYNQGQSPVAPVHAHLQAHKHNPQRAKIWDPKTGKPPDWKPPPSRAEAAAALEAEVDFTVTDAPTEKPNLRTPSKQLALPAPTPAHKERRRMDVVSGTGTTSIAPLDDANWPVVQVAGAAQLTLTGSAFTGLITLEMYNGLYRLMVGDGTGLEWYQFGRQIVTQTVAAVAAGNAPVTLYSSTAEYGPNTNPGGAMLTTCFDDTNMNADLGTLGMATPWQFSVDFKWAQEVGSYDLISFISSPGTAGDANTKQFFIGLTNSPDFGYCLHGDTSVCKFPAVTTTESELGFSLRDNAYHTLVVSYDLTSVTMTFDGVNAPSLTGTVSTSTMSTYTNSRWCLGGRAGGMNGVAGAYAHYGYPNTIRNPVISSYEVTAGTPGTIAAVTPPLPLGYQTGCDHMTRYGAPCLIFEHLPEETFTGVADCDRGGAATAANAASLPTNNAGFIIEFESNSGNYGTVFSWGTEAVGNAVYMRLACTRYNWVFEGVNFMDNPIADWCDGGFHRWRLEFDGTTQTIYLDGTSLQSRTVSNDPAGATTTSALAASRRSECAVPTTTPAPSATSACRTSTRYPSTRRLSARCSSAKPRGPCAMATVLHRQSRRTTTRWPTSRRPTALE